MKLLIVGLIAASQAVTAPDPTPTAASKPVAATTAKVSSSPEEPDTQKQFCALVDDNMRAQSAYARETNPIRKASMKQPNPQTAEAEIKNIFGQENQFVDWVGTLQFSVYQTSVSIRFIPDCNGATQHYIQFANNTAMRGLPLENERSVLPLSSPLAKSLAAAPSSNIRVTVTGEVIPFSSLTKFNNFLNGASHPASSLPMNYKSSAGSVGASVASPNYLTKFENINVLGDANKK